MRIKNTKETARTLFQNQCLVKYHAKTNKKLMVQSMMSDILNTTFLCGFIFLNIAHVYGKLIKIPSKLKKTDTKHCKLTIKVKINSIYLKK